MVILFNFIFFQFQPSINFFSLNPVKIFKILPFFFFRKKNYKDLDVGQNLMEFAKIHMPESLRIFLIFFF
jgi:hypothetical protein